MARRRHRSERERDLTNTITNELSQPFKLDPFNHSLFRAPVDQAIEDRRRHHPLKQFAPPAATRRSSAHLVLHGARALGTKAPVGFRAPNHVMICIRRKNRKEVLHALKKTGKGKGNRKPRRNIWSDIKC